MWHRNHHLINAYQQILRWNINWFCCFPEIKLIKIALDCGVKSLCFMFSVHSTRQQIAWLKVDTQTILSIQTHIITKNHRMSVTHVENRAWVLRIKDVKESDKGWYMCQVRLIENNCNKISLSMNFLLPDQHGSDEKSSWIPECRRWVFHCKSHLKSISNSHVSAFSSTRHPWLSHKHWHGS